MTLFLASVRDAAEAGMARGAGADVIDLKDPGQGALGALPLATIAASVRSIAGRVAVSATIGDLPLDGAIVRDTVRATSAAGVDYVKLGLFPGTATASFLSLLAAETPGVRLILVLFADALPDFDAVRAAARIGASGVMLDTLGKEAGSLLDHLTLEAVARFVAAAKTEGLMVGLAGSLKAKHVPALLALGPDLLGFRGALCRGGARNAGFNPVAAASIRTLIPPMRPAPPKAESPALAPQALC
jgi:(5-formylfuran-3-yl)methyl phosphate synthase